MSAGAAPTPALAARGLTAGYGGVPVVKGIDLHVERGEVVVLLGPNGAGKTTTLLALAGVLPLHGGSVTLGASALVGPLHKRARRGVAFVSEQRSAFMRLSTLDNLKLGRGGSDSALQLFPELTPLLTRRAGLLSGGEQQMLTVARALAAKPKVLLADELSLGLAPLIVDRLLVAVRQAAAAGTAVLMVEQHAHKALRVADRAYVLRRGEIALAGSARELQARMDELERSYLSTGVSTE